MTRRDFELIADAIACGVKDAQAARHIEERVHGEGALFSVAKGLAVRLPNTNPRFDRDRFMAACGFKGE